MIMRFIILLTMIIASVTTVRAQSDEARKIRRADEMLNTFIRNNDAGEAAKFYAHDFKLTTSQGISKNRDDMIREVASPQLQFEVYHTEEVAVIVEGHTAVLSGVRHQRGVQNGKPFEARLKVTDTWVRTVHGWKILSGRAIQIPKTK